MVKKPVATERTSGKVRFIMLEADIADDSLSVLAQAITAAIRPTLPRRALVQGSPPPPPLETDEEQFEQEEDTPDGEEVQPRQAVAAKTVKAPRKYYTPKVIDVDLDSGVSFEAFANEKGPTEITKRYLVVAAWFKEHRNTETITADHVYTSFKKVGWSTGVKDFVQAFRDIARHGWGASERRNFTINHIGLDVVNKMAAS